MFADPLLLYKIFKALQQISALKYLLLEFSTLTSDVSNEPKGLLYHCSVIRAKYVAYDP
jgi:hypothetical protein